MRCGHAGVLAPSATNQSRKRARERLTAPGAVKMAKALSDF